MYENMLDKTTKSLEKIIKMLKHLLIFSNEN